MRYVPWINTRKKQVEKAVGDFCFLIVGKTEKKKKKYYLWSFFKMSNWEFNEHDFYDIWGRGFNFEKPPLLNNLIGFDSFKEFWDRIQLINKHPFLAILHALTKEEMHKLKVIFPPFDKSFRFIEGRENNDNERDLREILNRLNEKMLLINSQKRLLVLEQILRDDRKIVDTLKKIANYQCQYPSCESKILMRDGTNYVEVAHIKPVKEGGKSIVGNLLVLCPNHHKEFDYGNLEIKEQSTDSISGILNGKEFIIDLI